MTERESPLPDDGSPSGVFRRRPVVMLVKIDRDREAELHLADLPVSFVRVRHTLPAVVRASILRPEILILGPGAHPRDITLLLDVAFELESGILQLSPLVAAGAVRGWVARMLEVVGERRAAKRAAG